MKKNRRSIPQPRRIEMDYSEKWGKDVEEAVKLALNDLKVSREEVKVIVLEEPVRGFLGIGAKLAKVRVEKIDKEEEELKSKSAVREPEKGKTTFADAKSEVKAAEPLETKQSANRAGSDDGAKFPGEDSVSEFGFQAQSKNTVRDLRKKKTEGAEDRPRMSGRSDSGRSDRGRSDRSDRDRSGSDRGGLDRGRRDNKDRRPDSRRDNQRRGDYAVKDRAFSPHDRGAVVQDRAFSRDKSSSTEDRYNPEEKYNSEDYGKNRISISDKPANLKPISEGNEADKFFRELTEKMLLEISIKSFENDECVYLEVEGKDSRTVIGKRGQTLDAIQYLTNLVMNKNQEKYIRVIVDVEGYRSRRERTLEQLAGKLARKVEKTGRSVKLEPMNPYERKVIHSTLQSNPRVTTRSEGEEPYRRVIIEKK